MMSSSPLPQQDPKRPSADMSWDLDAADVVEDHEREYERTLGHFYAPAFWYRLFRRFRYQTTPAMDEWLAYYQGRYTTSLPDVKLFQSLLARNGCWDISCPFVPGSSQASQFCQDGVFLADIHYLLDRWVSHVLERGLAMFEVPDKNPLSGADQDNPYVNIGATLPETVSSPFPLWVSNYSPIHYQQAMEMRATDLRDLTAAVLGAHCLVALFLDHSSQWVWLKDRLHADNRALLSTIVYEAAATTDREALVAAWVKQNWVSETSAKRMVEALSKKAPPVILNNEKE